MGLTHDDLSVLKAHFKPEEHEFLKGNAYITESAITDRIEQIDPAWTFVIINEYPRDNQCICVARMTIKGVSRDGVGMQPLTIKKKDGEIIDGTDPEKSAATDALKRCARLFGVGRYLLDLPGNVTDEVSMARFLNGSQGVQNGSNSRPTQQRASTPTESPETAEWIATQVQVKLTKQGKPYLLYLCDDNKRASGRGRDLLRQAGYDCESWTEPESVYPLQPMAAITVERSGDYWNVTAVKQLESERVPF